MTETTATAESTSPFAVDRPGKEHRGYTPTFALASFGLFFAILTPDPRRPLGQDPGTGQPRAGCPCSSAS